MRHVLLDLIISFNTFLLISFSTLSNFFRLIDVLYSSFS